MTKTVNPYKMAEAIFRPGIQSATRFEKWKQLSSLPEWDAIRKDAQIQGILENGWKSLSNQDFDETFYRAVQQQSKGKENPYGPIQVKGWEDFLGWEAWERIFPELIAPETKRTPEGLASNLRIELKFWQGHRPDVFGEEVTIWDKESGKEIAFMM